MSVSVALTGAAAITEAQPYTVSLSAGGTSGAIANWSLDWGDGSADATVQNAGSASHAFDGTAPARTYTVTATGKRQQINPAAVDGGALVRDVAVQADGKVVAVGGDGTQVEVRRFNSDGTPDTSFGGGRVAFAVTGASSPRATSVAIDSAGRIVVAGTAVVGAQTEYAVARLSPGGSVEFTAHGLVGTGTFGTNVSEVLVGADGSILVGGTATTGSDTNFAIARFTAAGLDATFDGDGWASQDIVGREVLGAMTFRTDGNGNIDGIIAAGTWDRGVSAAETLVAQFTLDGVRQSFATHNLEVGYDESVAEVELVNQKILVAGHVARGEGRIMLARFDLAGAKDTGFGVGGVVSLPVAPAPSGETYSVDVEGMALDGGNIFVGTKVSDSDYVIGAPGFAVFGFDPDGRVLSGFGNNGSVYTAQGFTTTGRVGGGVVALPGGGLAQVGAVADTGNGGTEWTTLFYGTGSTTVSVANVAPTATVQRMAVVDGQLVPTSDNTAVAYEISYIEFAVDDVSAEDARQGPNLTTHPGISFEVNWGDGSPSESGTVPAMAFLGSHTYSHSGNYTVTLTATDRDGGRTVATKQLFVPLGAVVGSDPYHGGTTLVVAPPVAGTAHNKITVQSGSAGVWAVVDGVATAPVPGVSRVVVYGNEGDDDIKVADTAAIPVEFFGGEGNDRLKGGVLEDVLSGDEGDDMLVGAAGRDFLVGGDGADKIVGDAEDDILVGGIYDAFYYFDLRRDAAAGIMREWTGPNLFASRVENIRAGTEVTAWWYLIGEGDFASVFDDFAADKLTGNAGQDWFFANKDGPVADKITDLLSADFTDEDRSFVDETVA